jgi:hypothetical protein
MVQFNISPLNTKRRFKQTPDSVVETMFCRTLDSGKTA